MKLKELADKLGAELTGPPDVDIRGAAGIHDAGEGQITFISRRKRAQGPRALTGFSGHGPAGHARTASAAAPG